MKVGVFYVITNNFKTGKLFTQTIEVPKNQKSYDAYHAGYHVDFWKILSEKEGYDGAEHEFFPRGRVNYFEEYLEVLSDRCLLRHQWFKENIMKHFPATKYKFQADRKAHYSCFKCRKKKKAEVSTLDDLSTENMSMELNLIP